MNLGYTVMAEQQDRGGPTPTGDHPAVAPQGARTGGSRAPSPSRNGNTRPIPPQQPVR